MHSALSNVAMQISCFAGGTEAAVSPAAVAGFAAMKAMSTRNDEPTKASRPFDKRPRWFRNG